MGTLLFRNAVVWRLIAMIFYLVFTAGIGKAEDLKKCDDLDSDSVKHDFLFCIKQEMTFKKIEGLYPVADFSNFTQDEFNKMTMVKNDRLIHQKTLKRLFAGNFLIKNSQIQTVTIGFYVPRGSREQSFILEDNWYLENVIITTPTVDYMNETIFQITIRNNKRLSRESLEALRSLEYNKNISYIQKFGECDVNQNGIPSIEDLEDCHYTTNDLIINDGTDLSYNKKLVLKEVQGCVHIRNTLIEHLTVLESIETITCSGSNEIVNNDKLCLHPEHIYNLTKWFNDKLEYRNNSDCAGECSSTYLFKNKDPACEIINGTISFNETSDTQNLTYLRNIKEIRGRLVIRSTNLSYLVLFPKLKLIDATSDTEPAIEVRFNKNLVNFTLPDNITIRIGKNQKSLQVMQNGNFTISEELKTEWENSFGNGSVMIDEIEKDPGPYVDTNVTFWNNSSSSTEEESEDNSKPKEAEFHLTKVQVYIIGTVLVAAFFASIILGYTAWVLVTVLQKRKPMVENYRQYGFKNMTELKVPQFQLVPYPYDTTQQWMAEASAVLENNKILSNKQEEERLKRKEDEPHLFVQKNSEPVFPLYTRIDARHRTFMHEIGVFTKVCGRDENGYAKCINEKCRHFNKPNEHTMFCMMECQCSDYGIQQGGFDVFGVRMESVPLGTWQDCEIEKIHHLFFQHSDVPITYEELCESTIKRLETEGKRYIEDEREFQLEFKTTKETSISGIITFKRKEKEKEKERAREKEEKERDCGDKFRDFLTSCKCLRCLCGCFCPTEIKQEKREVEEEEEDDEDVAVEGWVYRYTLSLYTYTGANNQLNTSIKCDITAKPPSFGKMFKRTFFRTPIFSEITLKEKCDAEFLEDIIEVHLNAPLGKWVTNYTAEDVLRLCDLTLAEMGENAYIELNMEVRIIGEIRGKFDDLRKGLCLPSKNAKKGQPLSETTHVFLGNYAGPFQQSMEVICLLFALKATFKDKYIFLRGPLDWREMGDVSGLKLEVNTRFPEKALEILSAINEVFDYFPLACKLGGNILCTNAGIAPKMIEVVEMSLPIQDLVPDTLPFNMMFAQPNWTVKRFYDNVDQKAGYYFGYEAFQYTLNQFKCQALFCSKKLESGYGIFGYDKRLYSLCAFTDKEDGYIAQAEFDNNGRLEIQALIAGKMEKIEYNGDKPRPLEDAAKKKKKKTNSHVHDVVPKSVKGGPEKKKNSNEKELSIVCVIPTKDATTQAPKKS